MKLVIFQTPDEDVRYSCMLSPVCEVVVGVGHVDQTLDEVRPLNEAEEHLQTHKQTSDDEEPDGGLSLQPSAGGTLTSVSRGMCRPFPCSTVDLRDLPGQARLRWLSARPDQEKTSW